MRWHVDKDDEYMHGSSSTFWSDVTDSCEVGMYIQLPRLPVVVPAGKKSCTCPPSIFCQINTATYKTMRLPVNFYK